MIGTTAAGHPLTIGLDDLIGSHLLVAANSGGGKSGAIRKLAEITAGQVQQIFLDPEDEFYTLRERHAYVIAGGEGADAPATVEGAGELARAALANGFSLIVQLNDLGKDAPRFIARFLEALLAAPRDQWRPLLVVLDEAQRFAPTVGSTDASDAIKDLLQRGRKRGFTAVLASTRVSELDAGVRGLARNWMLGFVGQSLDRRTAADQLGFAPSSAEAKGLQRLEPRQFWGFGPAISRTPVLFTVGDVETTIVKSGQAKVPTPPAPEALREILAGLRATSPKAEALISAPSVEGEKIKSALEDRIVELDAALAAERARASTYKLQRDFLAYRLIDIRGAAFVSAADYDRFGSSSMIANRDVIAQAFGGKISFGMLDAKKIPAQGGGGPEVDEGQTEGRQVMTSAAPRVQAPAPAARTVTEKAGGGNASPAALAIADLLDRINPAKVTWSQAATMTGRKASGGNFNAARKWLRESGRIVEDGEFIRSSADAPAGMTRAAAIDLWKSVLTNPAPKMIDALLSCSRPIGKDDLGQLIGAAPRGGNFNNGLAQLRRNGLLTDVGGGMCLANPFPGEK